ncbi:MAG: hypothetical protein JXL84_16350, partial [Deltaproteobacteria bacterium]|nr:hypothetical protein [Deltaproteobacteria bacterium]
GAGILLLLQRHNWKGAAWIMVIGCITMGSMLVYLPVIGRAGESFGLHQIPINVRWIAGAVMRAVSTSGPVHMWAWAALTLIGILATSGSWMRRVPVQREEGGVGLFFLVILLGTPVAYALTLLRLKVPTQFWYYVPLMAVVSITIDGLLGGHCCSPWIRTCRLILTVALAVSALPAVWQEVHARRTNMDIAVRVLMQDARPEDLIIVDPFYLGTSFDRYYGGKTRWVTLPPVENPRSGGYDDVKKVMMERDPLKELLASAAETLHHGNRVWVVGQFILGDPQKLPPPPPAPPNGPLGWNHGPYSRYWSLELGAFLLSHSMQIRQFSTDPGMPVNPFERVALVVFLPRPGLQEGQARHTPRVRERIPEKVY